MTADTTHAVLGEHTTRNLLYVALIRGRDTNQAYLYERMAGETEHEHLEEPGVHVARRGTSRQAAHLVRAIIGNRDNQARTAHDIAAQTEHRGQLPERVQHLLNRRDNGVRSRQRTYRQGIDAAHDERVGRVRWLDQHLSHDRGREQGTDYGIEL